MSIVYQWNLAKKFGISLIKGIVLQKILLANNW